MAHRTAQFRCYAELNDFLPAERRHATFPYRFNGAPAIKDAIEAVGIPHTEVELILIDGEPAAFDHPLRDGQRVAVYPIFEALDITPLVRLRDKPLRTSRFVLDVHLGRLARRLRMLGFDVLHWNDADDPQLAAIAAGERRILLTRDLQLLKHAIVTHGYWVRSTRPGGQLAEVLNRFDLYSQIAPFTRCMVCNGAIERVDKQAVWERLPERTRKYHHEFHICQDCRKVYWKGSHYRSMMALVAKLEHHRNR